jgi:2'-5' RNA ligase
MRLFVAVELDEKIRGALAKLQNELQSRCDGVRWVPAANLHLTVKFFGEMRDQEAASIAEALGAAVGDVPPFDLSVVGCGCFPPHGPVRIVWAGGGTVGASLERLVEAVEFACEALGFPRESRAFSPHMTIGRVRDDRTGGRLRAAVEAKMFEEHVQSVTSVTLMQSVLSPKGPTYTPVGRAALGRA